MLRVGVNIGQAAFFGSRVRQNLVGASMHLKNSDGSRRLTAALNRVERACDRSYRREAICRFAGKLPRKAASVRFSDGICAPAIDAGRTIESRKEIPYEMDIIDAGRCGRSSAPT